MQGTNKYVFFTFKPNLHYYIFIYFHLFTVFVENIYYLQVLPQALEIEQNTKQSVWVPFELPIDDLLKYLLEILHLTFIP